MFSQRFPAAVVLEGRPQSCTAHVTVHIRKTHGSVWWTGWDEGQMDMMVVWCVACACMSYMLHGSARTIQMLDVISGQLLTSFLPTFLVKKFHNFYQ